MTARPPLVRRAVVGILAVAVAGMPPVVAVAGVPPVVADGASSPADAAERATAGPERAAYPVQTDLAEPPADPRDASLKPGLTAYDALAPQLNDLQAVSDRVGVEVVGRTAGGRELYLVTVTMPETAAEVERQDRWRERIVQDPSAAARDAALAAGYKLPVFVSANIHGDEWDGTDAALRLVQDYATSTDAAVLRQLGAMRIHLVLSVNPDGRVAGTRENAAGFDLNRDLITASQPESAALRDVIVRTQPVLLLDLHGYVNGTLIDPTTPPHGENYEYDLFLKHAWPNALGMEAAIEALDYTREDGVNPPQIPLRDWHEGWDDWPPIFTPQYAALHGAVAHTVELPLRINHEDYLLPEAELRRRAEVNTAIAGAALTASLRYADRHREELLADHIEVFRRGVDGEAPRPVTGPGLPPVPAEDVVQTAYPRGYVIPVGRGQRSGAAAARLVEHLLANGVEVRQARVPVTVEGTAQPAGSYVVDLRQGRRGVARAILGPGSDLSDRVSQMYDVAGWSHGLLWGADVVTVPAGAALPPTTEPVAGAVTTGGVTGGGDLVLGLDDPADLAAVNALVEAGVGVELLEDAAVLLPAGHAELAEDLADRWGVEFRPAPNRADGVALEPLTVAAAADAEDRFALAELGFEVQAVDESVLNRGFDWSGVDALYVGRRLSVGGLDPEARAALHDFVDSGAGVVGQGVHGAELNRALDLLEVRAVRGTEEANGVVRVDSHDGPVGARATDHTFVEAPVWFRLRGGEVRVDQRLAGEDVLVSGHWRATAGAGGPDAAAGQPLVVSGVDETGAGVVLFGSDPLFRTHPKGQLPLVGRALLWATSRDG